MKAYLNAVVPTHVRSEAEAETNISIGREIVIEEPTRTVIPLIGFMGAGKTTVGKALAKRLDIPFYDSDEAIVRLSGRSISEIFEDDGEDRFRDLETRVLGELLGVDGGVISCGGGIVLRDENVDILRLHGNVVWLSASPETIFRRVRHSKERPLLNGNMSAEYIGSLLEKRLSRYESAYNIKIDTDDKSADAICSEIIDRLGL